MFGTKNKISGDIATQEKFIDVIESIQAVPKLLYFLLVVVLILAIPMGFLLKYAFYQVMDKDPAPLSYTPPNPISLETKDEAIFEAGSGEYYAYARVKNPNSDLAVKNLSYNFIVKNNAGEQMDKVGGVTYILPFQDKVILVLLSKDYNRVPADIDLELTIDRWSRVGNLQELNFLFSNQKWGAEGDSGFFVSAILLNDTPFLIPDTEVTVLLYNSENKVVAVNYTILNYIKAYENRYFKMVWPEGVSEGVTRVEFAASVNQLKPGSLSTEDALPDSFDPILR